MQTPHSVSLTPLWAGLGITPELSINILRHFVVMIE